MIIRRGKDRGFFNHGWLKSYHTFSFGEYYSKKFMNFHSLHVINEDFVRAKKGFGLHPHSSMEIITFVMKGTLTHSDNLGNREEIGAGCFQIMSAGDGIMHSEFNHGDEEVHLLQIWIMPDKDGGTPSYRIFKPRIKGNWALIAAHDDAKQNQQEDFLSIKQDASVYAIDSANLKEISLPKLTQKNLLLQVASGNITIDDGTELKAGDAIGLSGDEEKNNLTKIKFNQRSELILFGL
jgi:redox-sensitive bicupin YhaK (pirin superfamily)